MRTNCDCYRIESKKRYTYHPITGRHIAHDVNVGVCIGTKCRDECSCGGDRTKCDFYLEVREKAQKESNKVITNGDNIRSMNDEQLAEFVLNCTNNDIGFCHVGMCLDNESCTECALKWIQQSIKE